MGTHQPRQQWKSPHFDPQQLTTDAGRAALRNRGLRDQLEHADEENLALITAAHREITTWAAEFH